MMFWGEALLVWNWRLRWWFSGILWWICRDFWWGPFLWGFVWLANCGRWGKGQEEVANRALREVHRVTRQIHLRIWQIHLRVWQIQFAICTNTKEEVANRALREASQGVHLKIWTNTFCNLDRYKAGGGVQGVERGGSGSPSSLPNFGQSLPIF